MATDNVIMIICSGLGATLLTDVWALLQKCVLKVSGLNYALVGRWCLWMTVGRFSHQTIISAPPRKGETAAGWIIHYLSGVLLAFIPLTIVGERWLQQPAVGIALISGILSLVAPFLLMQPALGFGIAASKTPNPGRARLLSLVIHLVFGCGLYLSLKLLNMLLL
ncbi:membrane protein [Tatumella morbirosei]|uniref:Membrane protein n=1 Tax=Tatumella morbirosei TaxID=642227 RepID=A0A095T680_9GAMM|nr:DUF2938 domain-containing protein [Tatumella morbirosei]KGD72029.1 membrane protein [Tatumella morbirosei]